MKEPKVLVFENIPKLVGAFSLHFIDLINLKEGLFRVALSGGSTPKFWFEELAKNHKQDVEWERVHFYWGDERCVPPNDEDSNYRMTRKYLLDHIDIPKENIHRIQGERKPEEAARIYGEELLKFTAENSIPVFDLMILGMGEDGHTASIFPHQIEVWDCSDLCVVATHPISGQQRVSLTGKVINQARSIAFLITGRGKAEKVMEILYKKSDSDRYPASRVLQGKGDLTWFLDKPAASQI